MGTAPSIGKNSFSLLSIDGAQLTHISVALCGMLGRSVSSFSRQSTVPSGEQRQGGGQRGSAEHSAVTVLVGPGMKIFFLSHAFFKV